MKILDFYIIRKFLGTFFFAIALVIAIAIIFDISEKIDDFVQSKAPIKEIVFKYYLNFIPWFTNLFTPLFTFIAVIFFTAKMAMQTEIIATYASGVSFRRMLVPYMISAFVIALLNFYLNGWVIPPSNKVRLQFEAQYVHNSKDFQSRNKHLQVSPGLYAYFEFFSSHDQSGNNFTMEKIEDGKVTYKFTASRMRYDSLKNTWQAHDYFVRRTDGMNENIYRKMSLDTTFNFKPADFIQEFYKKETMNNPELDRFIESQKMKGSENIEDSYVEKYRRISIPFATFILTIIGVCLSSRKSRGGIGIQVGLGLALSFTYILFMKIFETFALSGSMPSLLAVWTPNIIYGVVAMVLLRFSQR